MSKLTKETRDSMPADDFAVPGKRALPIHDENHTRLAWDMVNRTKDLTPAERSEARRRIKERAKRFGIDTSSWDDRRLNAAAELIYAASLNISNSDHPNKAPFEGVLTRIDQPSNAPPEGSGGRRITISAEAAKNALPSLLAMGVDYVPNLDGHNPQRKIGVFTDADVVGDGIHVKGFLYAADFPDAVAEIKANKDALGFSYEARNLFVVDPDSDPVVVTACTFTGAAILRKDKAAYHSTSISASADKRKQMEEELKKLLGPISDGLTALKTQVSALQASALENVKANEHTRAMVEPHAKALESCAAAMEAAGIGGHPQHGHVVHARKMASHLRAAAALGHVPHIFTEHDFIHAHAETSGGDAVAKAVSDALKPITDKLAEFDTKLADVKAAAVRTSTQPERKTLSASITQLLAKAGIAPDKESGKLSLDKVDEMLKGKSVEERLALKSDFRRAGIID